MVNDRDYLHTPAGAVQEILSDAVPLVIGKSPLRTCQFARKVETSPSMLDQVSVHSEFATFAGSGTIVNEAAFVAMTPLFKLN